VLDLFHYSQYQKICTPAYQIDRHCCFTGVDVVAHGLDGHRNCEICWPEILTTHVGENLNFSPLFALVAVTMMVSATMAVTMVVSTAVTVPVTSNTCWTGSLVLVVASRWL